MIRARIVLYDEEQGTEETITGGVDSYHLQAIDVTQFGDQEARVLPPHEATVTVQIASRSVRMAPPPDDAPPL